MKSVRILFLLCLSLGLAAHAQTFTNLYNFTSGSELNPYARLVEGPGDVLYGTAAVGGARGFGAVYRINKDGSGYTVLKSFNFDDGASPATGLTLDGGVLYGTTSGGGTDNYGTIFRLSTNGADFTMLKDLEATDGVNPFAVLTVDGGVIYGAALQGGTFRDGTLFKLNTNGSDFAVLKHLNDDNGDGQGPLGGLAISGGVIYGTANSGGDLGGGTLFKVNTDGSGFTVLKHYVTYQTQGSNPAGDLLLAGGVLYGTTYYGGSSPLGGTVFKVNLDGSGYTVLGNLGTVSTSGKYPQGALALSGSVLYGTTTSDGNFGNGTIFKINTNGTGLAVLKELESFEGSLPYSGVIVSGSTLYGTTVNGGELGSKGVLFKLGTDGSGYTVLRNFIDQGGYYPAAGLAYADGVYYGATSNGGTNNSGTVFRINPDGSGYTVLASFDYTTHGTPAAGVTVSGGVIYGTTQGGSFNSGTIYKLNTNGTGFAVLKNLQFNDGYSPNADLTISGNVIYGTVNSGGPAGSGVVFRMKTDGTGYTVLKAFDSNVGDDGSNPTAGVTLDGAVLYGTTTFDMAYRGTLFKVNTNGSGYTVLIHFDGDHGQNPNGNLLLSGNVLYGTTSSGGDYFSGTVFKVNTDGTGHTVLKHFNYTDGADPRSGLVLSNNVLYGTTYGGGEFGSGTVFKVGTDGSGFATLKNFTYDDGNSPLGQLVLQEGVLYGTTYDGGAGYGTIFALDLNPASSGNSAPSALALSNNSVAENQSSGTLVGSFTATDPDAGDTFTFALVAGTGDTGNGSFTIADGTNLLTAASFDYETLASYSIRVAVTDDGGLSFTNTFTINVTNLNDNAPTDIALTVNTVREQQVIGTVVGSLSSVDIDLPNDTHTYSLVYHDGCEDNAWFGISGANLVTASNLLYSARSTYRIVIRTTDAGGLFYDEEFVIYVKPLPGTPPAPAFSNNFAANMNGWNIFTGLELTSDGSGHGVAGTNAAGNFGGYESGLVAGSGFSTSLDFNLETNSAEGLRFGYLVALNNSAHVATNEFAFLVMRTNVNGACGFRINTGSGLPGSFENLDGSADAPVDDANDIVITNSGWYTFQHWFHQDANTNLVAELTLLDANTNLVATWVINTTLKVPADAYGNRYAKIIGNQFTGLLVDNSSLTTIPKPVALATGVIVDEDEVVTVQLLGNVFPTGAEVRRKITVAPLHGSLSESTGVYFDDAIITYTPAADYFGTDSFKFLVNNGGQDSVAVNVSITVMSVNDAPSFTLSVSSTTVAEDSASTTLPIVNLASVDKGAANESGQIISYQVVPGYNSGLFMTQPTVSGIGYLTFRPAANVSGSTIINVRAVDNGGAACGGISNSAPSPFTINITPSNDVPVMVALTNVTVNEGLTSTPTVNVPIPVTDLETAANNLVLSVVLSNQTGGIVIPASVSTSYSAGWFVNLPVVSEASGQVNVHVTATDTGEGASPARSASRTFLFKVNAVNDAPGFLMASNSVSANLGVAATVNGFSAFRPNANLFPDPTEASQTATYTVTLSAADKLSFATQPTISPAGVLTFKYAASAVGPITATVKVTDNGGGLNTSTTQNLTFNVNP